MMNTLEKSPFDTSPCIFYPSEDNYREIAHWGFQRDVRLWLSRPDVWLDFDYNCIWYFAIAGFMNFEDEIRYREELEYWFWNHSSNKNLRYTLSGYYTWHTMCPDYASDSEVAVECLDKYQKHRSQLSYHRFKSQRPYRRIQS